LLRHRARRALCAGPRALLSRGDPGRRPARPLRHNRSAAGRTGPAEARARDDRL
jgi:hypothetical protein